MNNNDVDKRIVYAVLSIFGCDTPARAQAHHKADAADFLNRHQKSLRSSFAMGVPPEEAVRRAWSARWAASNAQPNGGEIVGASVMPKAVEARGASNAQRGRPSRRGHAVALTKGNIGALKAEQRRLARAEATVRRQAARAPASGEQRQWACGTRVKAKGRGRKRNTWMLGTLVDVFGGDVAVVEWDVGQRTSLPLSKLRLVETVEGHVLSPLNAPPLSLEID